MPNIDDTTRPTPARRLRSSPAVSAWLDAHAGHADLPTLTALCDLLDSADARTSCDIKWNAPSYSISEHFATTGLAPKGGVRLVLHTGAARREPTLRLRDEIEDPAGLLQWKDHDRAMVVFHSEAEVKAASAELMQILGRWIELTQ